MKRALSLLLIVSLLLVLPACKKQEEPDDGLPFVLNTREYADYQNIVVNKRAADVLGKTLTKEGVLAKLRLNEDTVVRYYVWGYNDATKCCDWQWEFVPTDPDSLPPVGSRVRMTGTFTEDDKAMDNYRFTDAKVELVEEYKNHGVDIEMTTMSATLELIQLWHLTHNPEAYEGLQVELYGRVLNPTTVQHPYYDNFWTVSMAPKGQVPARGKVVIVSGAWEKGQVSSARVEVTGNY